MIIGEFECALHGRVGSDVACLKCHSAAVQELRLARQELENKVRQEQIMQEALEARDMIVADLEAALQPFRENAAKADPMGAFATQAAVGMMQKEIERLEEKLRSAEETGMRFRNAGVALLRAWVDKDYDAVLAMIAIGEVH